MAQYLLDSCVLLSLTGADRVGCTRRGRFYSGKSFEFLGEALIALDCIKKYGNGEKVFTDVCFPWCKI